MLTDCSTGGIIALAFGDKILSLEDCDQLFTQLSRQAFTLRKGQNLHFFRHVQLLVKKSKYESRPLNQALKSTFTSDSVLFGRPAAQDRLKVAVTATSGSGSQAYVMSNYNTKNRRSSKDERKGASYIRYRPDNPSNEIKIWEA
jgi:hypothetical protein